MGPLLSAALTHWTLLVKPLVTFSVFCCLIVSLPPLDHKLQLGRDQVSFAHCCIRNILNKSWCEVGTQYVLIE
jgi:hypothetical protein